MIDNTMTSSGKLFLCLFNTRIGFCTTAMLYNNTCMVLVTDFIYVSASFLLQN